jgi:hypothetical protein
VLLKKGFCLLVPLVLSQPVDDDSGAASLQDQEDEMAYASSQVWFDKLTGTNSNKFV